MNLKITFRNNIKTIKNIIESVLENDFFGMASEMGFMLCIGICPFMLFLTALFGWIGKHSFMNPILVFMQNIVDSYLHSKVVLTNGEEAEIIFINRQNLTKPLVITEDGKLIDLSKETDVKIEKVINM